MDRWMDDGGTVFMAGAPAEPWPFFSSLASVSRQYIEVSRTCQFVDLFDWNTRLNRLNRPRIDPCAPLPA